MPRDETKIVQAAKAWARAFGALQEATDQGEAELAIYGVAERAQAFKEAERTLYHTVQQADRSERHHKASTTSASALAPA